MGDYYDNLRKLLDSLNEEISVEELRIARVKASAGGRWNSIRLGEIKHLYNLIEKRQLVFLKLTFPHKTFYAQARFAALELPNGKLIPLTKGQQLPVLELPDGKFIPITKGRETAPRNAKHVKIERGRISDIIEVSGAGDDVQPYEFKTRNAIVKSAGLAGDIHDIEGESFKKGAAKTETNVEGVIKKAAQALNAKVVVQCNDPLNGASVTVRIPPDKFRGSQVMTYGQIPDRLMKQEKGFIRLTLGSVAKDGSIHIEDPKMSKLPQAAGTSMTEATATSAGRPTVAQRGTLKVSEQGSVGLGGGAPKGKAVKFAERFVGSKPVGGAMKVAGGVNLAFAPIGVYSLASEFSGEAEAKRALKEILPRLNPDNFNVGDRFSVPYKDSLGTDYVIPISVENAADVWPYNLMPNVPLVKRFVVHVPIQGSEA